MRTASETRARAATQPTAIPAIAPVESVFPLQVEVMVRRAESVSPFGEPETERVAVKLEQLFGLVTETLEKLPEMLVAERIGTTEPFVTELERTIERVPPSSAEPETRIGAEEPVETVTSIVAEGGRSRGPEMTTV